MIDYHHKLVENKCNNSVLVKEESTYEYNEKIRKLYKLYRDTSTANFIFISTIIKECINQCERTNYVAQEQWYVRELHNHILSDYK